MIAFYTYVLRIAICLNGLHFMLSGVATQCSMNEKNMIEMNEFKIESKIFSAIF